jgi:surfeit locus 1 family protein
VSGTGAEHGARILLSPRWLVGHLLALGLIVLFLTFGQWQLRRFEQRLAENALIAERMSAKPERLQELLSRHAGEPEALDFLRTLVEGVYAPEFELLLRSRGRGGEPGWHVLTPLVLAGGEAVLVDRGWVPYALDEPPVAEASPPTGQVRIEGLSRLEQDPPVGALAALAPRDPPDGDLEAVYYVDVDRLAAQLPFELLPVFVELAAQEPPTGSRLPLPPLPPELSRGSHLSYALQWFSFAVIGIVGYGVLLWRTATGREPRTRPRRES